ncbi:hypothetical protein [Natronolimnobius baerhuensis]|uniref:DUF7993 domain-containing protein n=1 Tax=Natronolimnobius baerhuensis TaxID=253108 RepID=A0A202E497_9EURY|nr:hypothetical protein [Natronolimnobius baerhuensis]OVE83113.1 hypothetical protein B2G88_17020 [Natronolimnobius baerhuensis]
MVEERITDGTRIAQLLSSELDGREDGGLESIAVTNADRDVEPTAEGARAYDVEYLDADATDDSNADGDADDDEADSTRLARVYIHEDRARLEFEVGQEVAATAAEDLDLRVRPKASQPPRTLVFLEYGAAAKRGTDVVQAVCQSLATD